MKLDFNNKPCPIPVIETKKALLAAEIGASFELIVDNDAACENIKRLLASLNQPYELNGFNFKLIKSPACCEAISQDANNDECIFLKSQKIGEGELGGMLVVGFLTAAAERKNLKKVILINDAIFIACDANHSAHAALAKLEQKGVEIICCANCLNYFEQSPLIGRAGDAASIIDALFGLNTLSL